MDSAERFHDNSNGIISDKKFNLSWLPKDSKLDIGKWCTWEEARGYARTMNSCYPGGFADYRLPTKEEGLNLFDKEYTNFDIEGETIHIHQVFVPKGIYYLWTSEVNEEGKALRVNLRDGTTEFVDKLTRDLHGTKLVRTGEIKPRPPL